MTLARAIFGVVVATALAATAIPALGQEQPELERRWIEENRVWLQGLERMVVEVSVRGPEDEAALNRERLAEMAAAALADSLPELEILEGAESERASPRNTGRMTLQVWAVGEASRIALHAEIEVRPLVGEATPWESAALGYSGAGRLSGDVEAIVRDLVARFARVLGEARPSPGTETGRPAGEEAAADTAAPRPTCLNCQDAWLLDLLRPTPEAESFACSLTLRISIEEDGSVATADADAEAPELCRFMAETWAGRTRWELPPESAPPVIADLPLEFAVDRTVKPRCVENCEAGRVLESLRLTARDEGQPNCELTVGIRVGTEGEVLEVEVMEGGRHAACARAARDWARTTRWTPAYADGERVVVWISQTMRIRTKP